MLENTDLGQMSPVLCTVLQLEVQTALDSQYFPFLQIFFHIMQLRTDFFKGKPNGHEWNLSLRNGQLSMQATPLSHIHLNACHLEQMH